MHNRRTGSFRAAVGALFGLAVVAGCEATPDANAGSGMLAISAPETGAVAVIDVATGERRELVSAGGPYGAITIAPDKRQVAYAREADVGLDRTIFTVDVASGTSRRIAPTTGGQGVSIEWLSAGWFWYVFSLGDASRTGLVGPGQVDARRIGSASYVSLEASPVDDRITYSDCYQQIDFGSTFCLVVERLDGSERAVLATEIRGFGPRFSPDGSLVVYTTELGGESHLVTQPVLGGPVTDLGRADNLFLGDYEPLPGGSRFSPDGSELLVLRDDEVLAVALDGSGERVVVDARTMRAAFSSTGDVIYELMINTDMPPDDTPMYEYSSFIVTTSGETVPLRQADRECTLALVSASGAYVGYSCAQGRIYRVDGSHVLDVEGQNLLGFDRAELGVVTADRERVFYSPLDGAPAREVAAYFEDRGAIPHEGYDYAP